MVMVMAMMMMASRKYRAGEHHQKQGSCKNLFHGTNVAPTLRSAKRIQRPVSRDARGAGSRTNAGNLYTLSQSFIAPNKRKLKLR
jgi:hypothetical protein